MCKTNGPCDYFVSPSPFGLDFGTLDFGTLDFRTSDLGLTILSPASKGLSPSSSVSAFSPALMMRESFTTLSLILAVLATACTKYNCSQSINSQLGNPDGGKLRGDFELEIVINLCRYFKLVIFDSRCPRPGHKCRSSPAWTSRNITALTLCTDLERKP